MKGKPITRDGVKGHLVRVAPREGYTRFVPGDYEHHNQPAKKGRR